MKPVIGITMGDPAGIGAEIAVKALANKENYDKCVPIIIGDYEAVIDADKFCKTNLNIRRINDVKEALGEFGTADLIDLHCLEPGSWEYKKTQRLCGEASFQYIITAINLAMEGKIHAVVTGPINKESMNLAGHHYSGHTELFADYTNTNDYAMLLISQTLKVIHVTTHCSMREACDRIKKDRVLSVIKLVDDGLKLLGYRKPRVAVAGLNAHSSENGLFGWEEEREIIPAINAAVELGINVSGPIPPDTVFVKCQAGLYDAVVAMYHDQGHIPFKLSSFKLDTKSNRYTSVGGVNYTIGLPIIRTSVDHGTAYNKAGEGRANEESLIDAIDISIVLAKNKFCL